LDTDTSVRSSTAPLPVALVPGVVDQSFVG
jgi:hypothetical protein